MRIVGIAVPPSNDTLTKIALYDVPPGFVIWVGHKASRPLLFD